MRKIFSSILAVAMMLSMFTSFTAQAADLSASYEVAYVDASGNPVDLTTLKADDIFTAQVTIKNAAELKTAALTLTWDSSVMVPCKEDGTAYSKFTEAVAWRMHTKIKNEDDENVYSSIATEIDDDSVRYEIYTTASSDLLSGDKKFVTVRFKVVKTGDAKLAASISKMMEASMSEAAQATCTIPACVIGSTVQEPVIEYAENQTFVAVAENVVDKTGVTFKFTTDYDKAAPDAGSVNVPFNTYIESAEKAIVALTVTDIIEKVNDTAVSFEYVGVELY